MNYLTQTLAAFAAAAVLAACGGGDAEAVAAVLPSPGEAEAAPLAVRVEGCVVDASGRAAAVAVIATDDAGRTVASALGDAEGVFRLYVPARQRLRLVPDRAGAEALSVITGNRSMTLAGCLRAAA